MADSTTFSSTSPVPSRAALRELLPPAWLHASTLRGGVSLVRDVAALAGLYGLSLHLDSVWLVPFFAFAQGTLFWSLFVLGHDCGHASLVRGRRANDFLGVLLHTPLLVPYHAWQISHRAHHRFTSHVDRDVVWVPLTRPQLTALPVVTRWLRLRGLLLAFPFYLLRGTPGRNFGTHYDPRCSLFSPTERRRVACSVALCGIWFVALLGLAAWQGPFAVLRHFWLPWAVFCGWAALVTYLHHTDPNVAWYRDGEWTPLLGGLATVDRHYGVFEMLHHDAGCHTVHHLFPQIPHHRLRQASRALAPVLGEARIESSTPIWRALAASARGCEVVSSSGSRVRYEALPRGVRPAGSCAASSPATR